MENIHKNEEPPIKEVLRRIRELEHTYAHLKQDMLKLKTSRVPQKCNQQKSKTVSSVPHVASPSINNSANGLGGATRDGGMVTRHSNFLLTESRCSNILESITQPIHITNAQGRIIYRNWAWGNFYGLNGAETLGKALSDLVLECEDTHTANDAIKHILNGESWAGEFPVKNKKGERFLSFGSCKPLSDAIGNIVGIISVTAVFRPQTDHQQPSPSALASKISDLATKVKAQMKKGETHMFHGVDAPYGEFSSSSRKPVMNSYYMIENRPGIKDMISAKAEQMVKNGFSWPWRKHEREEGWFDSRTCRYCRRCSHCDQEHD